MKRSTFKRGSGCFTCTSCGKRTRDVDGNGNSDLCPTCYGLAGCENMHNDNCLKEIVIDEIKAVLGCSDEEAEERYQTRNYRRN